jgi:hypothetical protein
MPRNGARLSPLVAARAVCFSEAMGWVGVSAASPSFPLLPSMAHAPYLVMHSMTEGSVLPMTLLPELAANAQNYLKHAGHAMHRYTITCFGVSVAYRAVAEMDTHVPDSVIVQRLK